MPLTAIIGGLTVCVHGGIGPGVESAESITPIERQISAFTGPEVK
jgi:hypothetical protein